MAIQTRDEHIQALETWLRHNFTEWRRVEIDKKIQRLRACKWVALLARVPSASSNSTRLGTLPEGRRMMRNLLGVMLATSSACFSSTTRGQIKPADYGLSEAQWQRCEAHFGPAGNDPSAEAEWCTAAENRRMLADEDRSAAEAWMRALRDRAEAEAQAIADARPAAKLQAAKPDYQARTISASAHVCSLELWRKFTEGEIAKERRYALEVGVTDLAKLEHLKEMLEAIDDAREAQVKGWEGKLRPCGDLITTRVARCLRCQVVDAHGTPWTRTVKEEGCSEYDLQQYLALLKDAR